VAPSLPLADWPRPHWPSELSLLAGALLAWAGGEYLRVRRKPVLEVEREAQRVLNRIDRVARRWLLRPRFAPCADRLADTAAYVAMPAACLASLVLSGERQRGRLLADGLLVGQALTATGAVNQAIKFLAPRERPFVHSHRAAHGKDRYGSFFSSHTSAVTAMATATTLLGRARGRSRLLAVPLFGLALATGYLRIAGDQHYLTDVLAGLAFGAATGAWLTGRRAIGPPAAAEVG
jgi:hypothetical protein